MRPTREEASRLLSCLRSAKPLETAAGLAELWGFLERCSHYLPSRAAVERDASKKRSGRTLIIMDGEQPPAS